MTQALAQARKALEAIVDTLDAEEMGEGPPASQHVAHWQKLHEDAQSALAAIDAALEGGAVPKVKEWRCFHCDETLTNEWDAKAHFGRDEGCTPACQIKGAEGGLVTALRRAEQDAADAWAAIHNEATDAAKAYHAQAARHREQLIAVEQVGYDRGIADAKAHPETLGLSALDLPSPPTGA